MQVHLGELAQQQFRLRRWRDERELIDYACCQPHAGHVGSPRKFVASTSLDLVQTDYLDQGPYY
jgi:hypothetical protein